MILLGIYKLDESDYDSNNDEIIIVISNSEVN